MGEISPIGDRSGNSRVQPINWTEKANLNQRRTGNPSLNQRPEGVVPPEEVPQLDLYDGETPLSKNETSKAALRAESKAPAAKSAETKPATAAETKPATAAETNPATAAETKPATSAETKPATAAETKPATAAEPSVVAAREQKTFAQTMEEMPLSDLQAKRAALIKAGTAESISELAYVNDELAKRGQFRSALGSGVRQGSPAALSAPEPNAVSSESAVSPENALAPRTVKLTPEQLPPEVRSLNFQAEEANSGLLESGGALSTILRYGCGTLSLVGGVLQVANGINEWQSGHYGEGAVTSLAGICNTTGGGALLASGSEAAMALATRACGVGAILDGGLQLYKGFSTNNDVQVLDGGVKTALGTTMVVAGSSLTGAAAGSALGGWAVGRMLGGMKVAGEQTLDDAVTEMFYNAFFAA